MRLASLQVDEEKYCCTASMNRIRHGAHVRLSYGKHCRAKRGVAQQAREAHAQNESCAARLCFSYVRHAKKSGSTKEDLASCLDHVCTSPTTSAETPTIPQATTDNPLLSLARPLDLPP
jgi:hypothetical protein